LLGLKSSQRGFEYWQLLVRLEASEAFGGFHHAGGGPTQRMLAFRHRFTLRQTRRTVPITFSMELVQASERRSCAGSPRRLTVRISSIPSRMLPATPGAMTDGSSSGPAITLDEALTAYEPTLRSRGAGVYNAKRPRHHLSAAMLATPILLLTEQDLERWRDGMQASGLAPSTVNRIMHCVRAALTQADRDAHTSGAAG
jgi:hypothetical protein